MKKIILPILALSLFVFSCSNDDDNTTPLDLPLGAYDNGALIVGEGGFSTSGTLSYVSNDLVTTQNDAFFTVNDENVGSFFQSIGFNENLAYLVVDNGTVSITDRYTLEKTGEIPTGLQSPRYIAFSNGKGYVSNWGDPNVTTDDFIAVVNLITNEVESTIAVGEGPEQIIANGTKLYVSHKGGYNTNNIISVINVLDNSKEEIGVNSKPDEMFVNNLGELLVLCGGNEAWTGNETTASITKINMNTNTVSSTLTFADGIHPSLMTYDNGRLYYEASNKIYGLLDTDSSLPTASIIDLTVGYAYGLSVNGDKLYVSDASFTGQSELVVYDLNTLTISNTFNVGLGASKVYFN